MQTIYLCRDFLRINEIEIIMKLADTALYELCLLKLHSATVASDPTIH